MFWVDIEDAQGVKLGDGPIATGLRWRYKQRASKAGEFELEVPLAEPRLLHATLKRRLYCYSRRGDGSLLRAGCGIIESRRYGMSPDGVPTMILSGPDLLRELAGKTVNFEVSATATPPTGRVVLSNIAAAMPSWTIEGILTTNANITARFVHESALNALISTCEKIGAYFFLDLTALDPRTIVISGDGERIPSTDYIATNMADPIAAERNADLLLINDVEVVESSWDAINQVIVYGAGEGQARLTLAMSTVWPNGLLIAAPYYFTDRLGVEHVFVMTRDNNTITDNAAVINYGLFEQSVAFKDIGPVTPNEADMVAAANTLVVAAFNHLLELSTPTEAYRLSVTAVRGNLRIGSLITVVARQSRDGITHLNINRPLIVQEIGYELDAEGEKITGLSVGTSWKMPDTGATILSDAIRKLNSFESHPQIGASENTLTYREDVDDDYGAGFPFWLSRATLQINSVTLRFKLEALRSSVKTIGGTASGTVDVPDHSHSLTAHSHDIPDHSHRITINEAGGSWGQVELVAPSGGGSFLIHTVTGGGSIDISTDADSGSTTSDDNSAITVGGGSTGGVSLDISNAISAAYGVYVDTDPPYGVADLTWKVNAVTVTETPTAIVGGWYELDLTDYVINTTTLRPLSYANTVTVEVTTPGADKRVRVTAQIELRTTIQTTAVV